MKTLLVYKCRRCHEKVTRDGEGVEPLLAQVTYHDCATIEGSKDRVHGVCDLVSIVDSWED